MTAFDDATRQTKTTATAISSFQKTTYVVGVQLIAWILALHVMLLFYGTPYSWWWPWCFGKQILFILSTQFMPEAIAGTKWSKIDWELVLSGAFKYTTAFCIGSPLIWFHMLKVQECADLKGPMQYFCTQEGGEQASFFYSPDHAGDIWNTDTVAWLLFVPMLVVKMCVYETILDFVFWTQHRLWHEVPWLYRLVHKHHHTLTEPQKTGEDCLLKSWHSTNMTFLEIAWVLTEHIPCMAFMICVFGSNPLVRVTGLDAALTFAYHTMIEFLGHVDHELPNTINPVPACNILNAVFPGWLLQTSATHALHHELVTCNYGACMMVWDWLFGTFESPEGGVGKWRKKVQ